MLRYSIRFLLYIVALSGGINASAVEPVRLRHQFEAAETSWVVSPGAGGVVKLHARSDVDSHGGDRCEQINFQSNQVLVNQRIEHELPQARVFDELVLSIWVRSNCAGLRLGVEIFFPHQIDPRTGKQLVLDFIGERYTESPEWQRLNCATTDEQIRDRLVRAREELSNGVDTFEIDSRDMIVRSAFLLFDIPEAPSGILIDDLELGPIVDPRESVASLVPDTASAPVVPAVKLEIGDRITRDGQPFFPLFSILHDEPVDRMAALGINMLWVPDYSDQVLLKQVSGYGLGAIAVPPRPSRDLAVQQAAGLPPFPDTTTPVWAWMLGAPIPPEELSYVEGWASQIHSADRDYRRPLMGEVLSRRREFHRTLTFLGSTRIPMQTSISPSTGLRRAQHDRALALPGKATFTFINTEPDADVVDSRPEGMPFPALEPEQILMQCFAASAAGYRGLGFYKQYPLTDSAPGMVEREQAIRLACIEARLLEEFLANGRVVREVAVQIGNQAPKFQTQLGGNNPFLSRWDSVRLASGEVVSASQSHAGQAWLIQSDSGLMVVPLWLEEGGQYVPGPQERRDVRFLLPPGITAAWEVTTTGVNSRIELTPTNGGTEAHLSELSMHSVIIASGSRETLDELRERSRQFREEAARSWIQMTAAKLERTRSVDAELVLVGAPACPGSETKLSGADALLAHARKQLEKGSHDEARRYCEKALAYLESVQRMHWENTVNSNIDQVSSPYTISFQSLPMHWRLMAEIGKADGNSINLLDSGSFEDQQAFLNAGWQVEGSNPTSSTHVRPRVAIERGGAVGKSALVLELPYIVKGDRQQEWQSITPARVASPPVTVSANDIVLITGQIRVPQRLDAPDNGFLIFDSLYGISSALRWELPTGREWKPFQMIRHIRDDGELSIILEMQARGRVEVDDLQVVVIRP